MSRFSVSSGGISEGVKYRVVGEQSVTYNSVLYTTGQIFTGVNGITTFAYSGTGTQIVNRVFELKSISVETPQKEPNSDVYTKTKLAGISVAVVPVPMFPDAIKLMGISIEVIDYPSFKRKNFAFNWFED